MKNDIFSRDNIFIIDEYLDSKNELFKLVSIKAFELNYVKSVDECYEGLLYRENQQTTGFQDGFAIPHCKDNTVFSPKVLVFKTNPIDWDSLDGKPVTVSLVVLVPQNASNEHLKLLAKLAKALIDNSFQEQIKNGDFDTIYNSISLIMEDK